MDSGEAILSSVAKLAQRVFATTLSWRPRVKWRLNVEMIGCATWPGFSQRTLLNFIRLSQNQEQSPPSLLFLHLLDHRNPGPFS